MFNGSVYLQATNAKITRIFRQGAQINAGMKGLYLIGRKHRCQPFLWLIIEGHSSMTRNSYGRTDTQDRATRQTRTQKHRKGYLRCQCWYHPTK